MTRDAPLPPPPRPSVPLPSLLALVRSLYPRHPARRMGFDELYAGLRRAVADRTVVAVPDPAGGLELYTYTENCAFDRRWDLFSLISRGLVLCPAERRVVATPFPKFFNYGEGGFGLAEGLDLPDEPFEVTEKVDGSLGIVFHHAGRWRVATRGAFASEQAAWAGEYLTRHVATSALEPGTTYLVEIVYPENRIVVTYDFEGLVLLGAYDAHGDELPRARLQDAATASGLRLAASRAFASMPHLLEAAESLCRDEEGFVVRFTSGLRVKIKGAEYCRAHRLMCQCSPLAVWEAMMNGDDLDARRRDLPEELLGDFDTIRARITDRLQSVLSEVTAAREATAHLSDKQLGLLLSNGVTPPPALLPCALTPAARRFLFASRKAGFAEKSAEPGELRRKLFQMFRPDGNRLPGYAPSKAASRFRAES